MILNQKKIQNNDMCSGPQRNQGPVEKEKVTATFFWRYKGSLFIDTSLRKKPLQKHTTWTSNRLARGYKTKQKNTRNQGGPNMQAALIKCFVKKSTIYC